MQRPPHRRTVWLLVTAAVGLAGPAASQPWKFFFSPPFGTHGYVEVAHHPDLDPASAFTFEAWILLYPPLSDQCASIAGKNWRQAWWIGICKVGGKPTLRSYLKGQESRRDAGTIPVDYWWAHVAVTFDGSKRRHYVDGELVGEFAETGPLPASSAPLRIFSDVEFEVTPRAGIREVRLWRVARTTAQLRSTINKMLTTPQPGLVAVWPLHGSVAAAFGPHDGVVGGTGSGASYPSQPCDTNDETVCLGDRFEVRVRWQHPGDTGAATVVPGFSSDSAIFWFFAPENWELLVKTVDGCPLNNRHWIFYAPVTDVHYDIEVFDAAAGRIQVFFGYQGATQGATDTDAFPTCP